MSQDGRIYDGFQQTVGCDSDTSASDLPANYVEVAVNRIFRRGVNSTRPPFSEILIKIAFGQDPSILQDFESGNFQGSMAYQAVKSGSADGIICSVAGVIYFIAITNNVGYLYKLIGGNDPTMMHTWFVQAEDWVYIQNGYQDPIAWSGDISGTPTNLRAQGLITNGIELSWTNNALGASYTEIQVQYSGSIFTTIATVPAGESTYFYPSTGLAFTSVSRSRTSNVATIVTNAPTNFTVGEQIIVQGMSNLSYDTAAAPVTAVDDTVPSFSYTNLSTNETSHADTTGLIGPEAANTAYAFQVRAVFPDGSFTGWSNYAATTVINPTKTAKQVDAIFRLNPVAQQMPIGTIMAYAYGRVAVSDKLNNIYISDIIYGTGFTTTSNTQNFTEQTYWQEGGSFTPPATLGQITGMKIMPSLNINVRGQGELVIFCENGSFSLDLSQDRTTWQTSNIQKVSLIGRGCRSPWSIAGINNETYFRSDDGWAFYNNAQLDFYSALSFRKISREVNRWVEQDTPWLRQFESAMFFDNRIIATVSPYTVAPADPTVAGLHRPSRAMIVMDVDRTSPSAPDAGLNQRWDGLWEGPQPTQLLTAQINGDLRGFAFSFDSDGVNRLYELQTGSGDDYSQSLGSVKIGSFFLTKRFDWSTQQQNSRFIRKQLAGGDMWLSDLNEMVLAEVDYRADSYPCFFTILPQVGIGFDRCTPYQENCIPQVSQANYYRVPFSSPDDADCEAFSQIPTTEAAEFQARVTLIGSATVERFRFSANLGSSIDIPGNACAEDVPTDPTPISCCPLQDLGFYRIIPPPNGVAN